MKTTNITKKIAAIFAAAIMATTISVSASALGVRVKGTIGEAASEQTEDGIPRGGKLTIRVMGEETNPELEGSVENPTFGVRV